MVITQRCTFSTASTTAVRRDSDPAQTHADGDASAATAKKCVKAQFESLGRYRRPIVTQIVATARFHRAEEYHQRYLEKRGLERC
jgi:peptide-methionine (S)-S-oxide reductase